MGMVNSDRIKVNINIHGWNVHFPYGMNNELTDLGFSFDGNEISGTVFMKSKFLRSLKILEDVGFEVEFSGSFKTGVFIKTVMYNS